MEEVDPTAGRRGQFYRNPTFLGVLIGVGALIVVVIVCLLLVAFRGGHISIDKIHGKSVLPYTNPLFNDLQTISCCTRQ